MEARGWVHICDSSPAEVEAAVATCPHLTIGNEEKIFIRESLLGTQIDGLGAALLSLDAFESPAAPPDPLDGGADGAEAAHTDVDSLFQTAMGHAAQRRGDLDEAQRTAFARALALEKKRPWRRLRAPGGQTPSGERLWCLGNVLRMGPPRSGGVIIGDSGVGKARVVLSLPGPTLVACARKADCERWRAEAEGLLGDAAKGARFVTFAKLCSEYRREQHTDFPWTQPCFAREWARTVIPNCTVGARAKIVEAVKNLRTRAVWCVGQDIRKDTARNLIYAGARQIERYTIRIRSSSLAPLMVRSHVVFVDGLTRATRDALTVTAGRAQAARFMEGHRIQGPPLPPPIGGDEEVGGDCAVCYETADDPVRLTGCTHGPKVCRRCMATWMHQGGRSCPLCRATGAIVGAEGLVAVSHIGRSKAGIIDNLVAEAQEGGTVRIFSSDPDIEETTRDCGIDRELLVAEPQRGGVMHLVMWEESREGQRALGRMRRAVGRDGVITLHGFRHFPLPTSLGALA